MRAPGADIYVAERPEERTPRDAVTCRLGDKIRICYDRLERFCWDRLSPLDIDLLVVGGAAAYADRLARRGSSHGWSRHLRISLPVHSMQQWESTPVYQALVEALNFLTGDEWEFRFRRRREDDEKGLQLPLLTRDFGACAVLAYSGGLDSFAQLKLELRDHERSTPLLITTGSGAAFPTVKDTVGELDLRHVEVPLTPRVGPHAEPTYRTRTFLFLSSAAVAWRLSRASEIVIAEPGPGAIGPSLVPFANEHPYRGTHPGFTTRFASFVDALMGLKPRISHPNLWKTKAQLLSEAMSMSGLEGWLATKSCSRNVPRQKGPGHPRACGICSGCLARRVALNSVGLREPLNTYFWQDLSAPTLDAAPIGQVGDRRHTSDTDRSVAIAAVVDSADLARASADDGNTSEWYRVVRELNFATGDDPAALSRKVGVLVRQHATEWDAFLAELPSEGWLRRLAKEV